MNTETMRIGKRLETPGNTGMFVPARPAAARSAGVAGDVELKIVPSAEWDTVAAGFADVIPEQTGMFNVGHWGGEKIECLLFFRRDQLIGGGAIIVRGVPFTSTGVAVVKWGPLWRRAEDTQDNSHDIATYISVIAELISEYCSRRGFHLTIMPPSVPEHDERMSHALAEMGFKEGSNLAAPERYIVNTHQDTETLMASFDQKWRYNLRKARKNDFEIGFADGEDGLTAFMDLYEKMMSRKGFLDSSAIGSLEDFVRNSPAATRPSIVLVSHQGSITAGGVFFTAGEMASYMFGATDDRALRLKAGYALHWWICEHLCGQDHVKWYDLGGNDLDAGLHQFKKGMVGKSGHILQAPPRFHYASKPAAKILGDSIFKLRDAKAAASRTQHKLKQWLRK